MLATIANIKDLKGETNKLVKFLKWKRYSHILKKKICDKFKGSSIRKGDLVDLGLVHAYLNSIKCNGNTSAFQFETMPADVRFDLVAIIKLNITLVIPETTFKCTILTVANVPNHIINASISIENNKDIHTYSHEYGEEGLRYSNAEPYLTLIVNACRDGINAYALEAIDKLKGYIYER